MANHSKTRPEKEKEKKRTMERWCEEWSTDNRTKWLYKLMPRITSWLAKKYGHVDYYLIQFLTGHGSSRVTGKEFKKRIR